jgi:hypothetical protein
MTSTWDEHWAEAKRADMIMLAHRLGANLKEVGPSWIRAMPAWLRQP